MNDELEKKIQELMMEAGRQGEWPVRAALHMLLSSYHSAQQRKFAKHCCEFSSVTFQMEAQVSDNPDDYMEAVGHNQYHH